MQKKYLVTLNEITKKENNNEVHKVIEYKAFKWEKEVMAYLKTRANDFDFQGDLDGKEVEVVLYVPIGDKNLCIATGYKYAENPKHVVDYFDDFAMVDYDSQEYDLYDDLVFEYDKAQNKKYKLVITRESIEDGKLIRNILRVYEPKNEKEILELLQGPVEPLALGGRVKTMFLDKEERTEVYLYEYFGKYYEDCFEYKTYKGVNSDNFEDYFKYKEEKSMYGTLLVFEKFLDKFKKPSCCTEIGRYVVCAVVNDGEEIKDVITFYSKDRLMKYLKEDATRAYLKNEFGDNLDMDILVFDRFASKGNIMMYEEFFTNENAENLLEIFKKVNIEEEEKNDLYNKVVDMI